jgi:hypothetical protein
LTNICKVTRSSESLNPASLKNGMILLTRKQLFAHGKIG